MHYLNHSHHVVDHFDKKVNSFSMLGFIFAIANSAFMMILPLILSNYLDGDKVLIGYYFSAFALVDILAGFLMSYLFLKFSRVHIFNYALLFSIVTILMMNLTASIFSFFILDIVRLLLFIIILTALIYFISDISTKKNLSKNLSIRTILNNIGGMIGVSTMGYIAFYTDIYSVFYFVPAALFIAWLYFHHMRFIQNNEHANMHKIHKEKVFFNIIKSFKDVLVREDLKQSALLYLMAGLWIAFMTNYKPILITDLGYSVEKLGVIGAVSAIFSIMSALFVGRIKNLKDLRFNAVFIMSSITVMSMLMLALYHIGANLGVVLPFVLCVIVFLFFLQSIASMRLIFFTYVFSAKERNMYTAFSLTIFSVAKLVLPLLVSFFISLGFELYQFFGVLAVISFAVAVVFSKRPILDME